MLCIGAADPRSALGFGARTVCCEATGAPRVHAFPPEPVLTWLDDADGPLRFDGHLPRVEILRHIPLRRLTYRLHDGAGPRGAGSGYRPGGVRASGRRAVRPEPLALVPGAGPAHTPRQGADQGTRRRGRSGVGPRSTRRTGVSGSRIDRQSIHRELEEARVVFAWDPAVGRSRSAARVWR